jgi:hypothetical protein
MLYIIYMSFENCSGITPLMIEFCNKHIKKEGYDQNILNNIIELWKMSNSQQATIESIITNISEGLSCKIRLKDILTVIPIAKFKSLTVEQKNLLCNALNIRETIELDDLNRNIIFIKKNQEIEPLICYDRSLSLSGKICPPLEICDGFIISRNMYVDSTYSPIIREDLLSIIDKYLRAGDLTMGLLHNILLSYYEKKQGLTILIAREIIMRYLPHYYPWEQNSIMWKYVLYPFVIEKEQLINLPNGHEFSTLLDIIIPHKINRPYEIIEPTEPFSDVRAGFYVGSVQRFVWKDRHRIMTFDFIEKLTKKIKLLLGKVEKDQSDRIIRREHGKLTMGYLFNYLITICSDIAFNSIQARNILEVIKKHENYKYNDSKSLWDYVFYPFVLDWEGIPIYAGYSKISDHIPSPTVEVTVPKWIDITTKLPDLIVNLTDPDEIFINDINYKNLISLFIYGSYSGAQAAIPKDEEYDHTKGATTSHIGFASMNFPEIVRLFHQKYNLKSISITPHLANQLLPNFKKLYGKWLERDTTKPVLQILERRNAFVDIICKGIFDTLKFDLQDESIKDAKNIKFGFSHAELFVLIFEFMKEQPEYVQTTWSVRTLSDSIDAKDEEVSLATLQPVLGREISCQTGIIERFYTTIGDIYCEPFELPRKRINRAIEEVRDLMRQWLEQYMQSPKKTTFFDKDEFNTFVDKQIKDRFDSLSPGDREAEKILDYKSGKKELASLSFYHINDKPTAEDLSNLLDKLLVEQKEEDIQLLNRYSLVEKKSHDLLLGNEQKLFELNKIENPRLQKIILSFTTMELNKYLKYSKNEKYKYLKYKLKYLNLKKYKYING